MTSNSLSNVGKNSTEEIYILDTENTDPKAILKTMFKFGLEGRFVTDQVKLNENDKDFIQCSFINVDGISGGD